MTFWPADFDPRETVVAVLDLCEIDTPDGAARFIIGQDGVFTDSAGNDWVGSALIGVEDIQAAINGVAPPGRVTLSYFQDPGEPDLIDQIKALGVAYVAGREIRFYVQPIRDHAEFMAPTTPPIKWATRIMRDLTFTAEGAQDRSISVGFETWAERRAAARRITYTTEGHAALIGEANPSFEFVPTSDWQEEKLF